MKLLIVIPALNEENSIESIIQQSLEARVYIRLIIFPQNRGYGAAIKEAWRQSDADLLAFLDADGTCDPRFFAPLAQAATEKNADIVLGCRLHRNSQMPFIRRFGNFVFAAILSIFSSSRMRDTASGMRIVRQSSLGRLFPLPDGLHFTPAMSARALRRPAGCGQRDSKAEHRKDLRALVAIRRHDVLPFGALILAVTRGMEYVLSLIAEQLKYIDETPGFDGVARAFIKEVV